MRLHVGVIRNKIQVMYLYYKTLFADKSERRKRTAHAQQIDRRHVR